MQSVLDLGVILDSCCLITLLPFVALVFTARRNARIAGAVLYSYGNSVCLSVRPSVCLSVCHTPVLCQNDGT